VPIVSLSTIDLSSPLRRGNLKVRVGRAGISVNSSAGAGATRVINTSMFLSRSWRTPSEQAVGFAWEFHTAAHIRAYRRLSTSKKMFFHRFPELSFQTIKLSSRVSIAIVVIKICSERERERKRRRDI